ncbi:hypothetical protein SISNIDRAFT_469759 [Sistotremastrum niveocremeum HHB9708]|uniref:Uncharacterized protein n=1 Tax=Sistotremastrum niveocremeum HHB9708 TaxID=1314777 RepID=A0A164PMC6_9AGAM|nr:hypothetical protein SISNIDRAFT_469759 [Sistotremastrum niveocremeum HHB9708]
MSLGSLDEGSSSSESGQSITPPPSHSSAQSDQNITFVGPDYWRPPIEATYVAPNVVELAALMLRHLDNYCEHWGVSRDAVADAFTALDGVKDNTRRLWADFMRRHCPSGSANVPLIVLANEMRLPSFQRVQLVEPDVVRLELAQPPTRPTVNDRVTAPSNDNDNYQGPHHVAPGPMSVDVEPVQPSEPADTPLIAPERGDSDVMYISSDSSEDGFEADEEKKDELDVINDTPRSQSPSIEIIESNTPGPMWATIRRKQANKDKEVTLPNIDVEHLPFTKSGIWPRAIHEPTFYENDSGFVTEDERFETQELQLQESVLKARKTLKDVFRIIVEPLNSDPALRWTGYIDQAVAKHYVFINWPYGLSPAKNWRDNNPHNKSTKHIAILLAALLHEDPSQRLCLVSRRHFPDDAQPALISYVATYGNMVISDEETISYDGNPVMPINIPELDGGPCDCNLEGCRPPDLEAYVHLRPRWVPKSEGSVDRRRKREEAGRNVAGPASKRVKVEQV